MGKRAYYNFWVYMITNKPYGVIYAGFTGGIDDRMEKHTKGVGSYFASKYRLKKLVYYEEYQYADDAIKREKQIKNWRRQWKINLLEKTNPNWDNLWDKLDSETSSE